MKNVEGNGDNRSVSNMERLEQCGSQLKESLGHEVYVNHATEVDIIFSWAQ